MLGTRKKVFIDGSAGTTGLRIRSRLEERSDIELLDVDETQRKDPSVRARRMNDADLVFLCLPDAASKEAVFFVENPDTVVIDTSTAHRTLEGWTYGFPELIGREKIAASKRIANPGCHASGFIALVAPLVRAGLVDSDMQLSCYSLTGYSGGGKNMIADYEAPGRDPLLDAPRLYGLSQEHKHLAEMKMVCGLETVPVFAPIVAPFYSGMEVAVPFFGLGLSLEELRDVYKAAYSSGVVNVEEGVGVEAGGLEHGFMSAGAYAGYDDMLISVCGNPERLLAVARYDNLGKGASGAAIQNMNIVFGLDEKEGLVIHV